MSISDQHKFWPLVPCAGCGTRSGADLPKQYVCINQKPIVAYTLEALGGVKVLEKITAVIAPKDALFEKYCPNFQGVIARVGGDTRAQSVRNGLDVLCQNGALDNDWVLVHDAARCLLKPQWVQMLIDACQKDNVGGLLAQPVPDTLKQVIGGRSVTTIARHDKWLAQTPQMFRIGALKNALDQAQGNGVEVTDEGSAIEAQGLSPLVIECSAENFKLTYAHDFERAGLILQARKKSACGN